ncbi:MAG TPA: hypothetical protein VMT30_06835 [Candidatus Saccharimonadia bacterium]|nr:hypothetical protein [Candidatus Saccharimonadia bacterium]
MRIRGIIAAGVLVVGGVAVAANGGLSGNQSGGDVTPNPTSTRSSNERVYSDGSIPAAQVKSIKVQQSPLSGQWFVTADVTGKEFRTYDLAGHFDTESDAAACGKKLVALWEAKKPVPIASDEQENTCPA